MLSEKETASQILVRPAGGGSHYFNGLKDLSAAVMKVNPSLHSENPHYIRYFIKEVRRELGLCDPAPCGDIRCNGLPVIVCENDSRLQFVP